MNSMKYAFLLLFLSVFITIQVNAQEVNWEFMNPNLPIDERAEILVSQMTLEEKVKQMINTAPAIPRLNVPEYNWANEALHGVARNGMATIFPQMIGIGASFDPELAERVASAISSEARAKYALAQKMGNRSKNAGLTFWSPNINIFRDAHWGRGQETFGEDPFLMIQMGTAFVRGMQGDDPKYLKTAACAKHYAVHSGPERLRLVFNAVPTQQDLWETYLPAFEALVKDAKVEGVMAAHNAVFGKPMAANKEFLTDILRDQWKFDGYIVTDCGAVRCTWQEHKYVPTAVEAAAVVLNAGTNLNCGWTFPELTKAEKMGLVTEETIHERCVQLFKTRFRLGMFDEDAGFNPYTTIGPEVIHSDEHIALAREAARKSIVLLKNRNNVLPLPVDIKVPYVTGPFANSNDILMGNYYGLSNGLVTIMEGLVGAMPLGTSLDYRMGALPFHENVNYKNFAPFWSSIADATICVVGISADKEGEGMDAIASDDLGDRLDIQLPQNQINYIQQLKDKIDGKHPLILVIASGSPVSLEGIEEYCDAILQIWYPGEQGGNAVADVIFGKVSPSGHLPITFPKSLSQIPPFEDYSMKGRTYKYMTEEPLFPFGFGLTYSKTQFDDLILSDTKLKTGENLGISVKVSNVGDYDIDEVVQVYICPADTSGGIPLKSLKRFNRITLKKGESKSLNFGIDSKELRVIDTQGKSIWRKGSYKVVVGNSSPGELSVKLGAAIPQEAIVVLK